MKYFGETTCEGVVKKTGEPCTGKAYYGQSGKHWCGLHSDKQLRKKLKRNPNEKAMKLQQQAVLDKEIARAAAENLEQKRPGRVICSKLRMMKNPEAVRGFRMVFPNYRHQKRTDGYGCASLSPKSLGPVNHGMPGLPVAKSIENYHQFAKVFAFEVDSKTQELTAEAKAYRIKGYESATPERHKYPKKKLLEHGPNANIPLYSLYYAKDGTAHRFTYIECRYFYCHWFEVLVAANEDLAVLRRMRAQGVNLQIVGYDGFQPDPQNLLAHYCDASRPFGHELVVFCLLVLSEPSEYPWNVYYQQHAAKYKDVI